MDTTKLPPINDVELGEIEVDQDPEEQKKIDAELQKRIDEINQIKQ